MSSKSLYVGNLAYSVGDAQLQNLFATCGTVTSVKVIMDRETGRSRGFAFVEMPEEDAAKAIQELNGKDFEGRALRISEAKPQEKKERHGGGGNFQRRR